MVVKLVKELVDNEGGISQKEVIRPDFNRAIRIDFQTAKITSDVGFLLVRGQAWCIISAGRPEIRGKVDFYQSHAY
jgi:hypothetical protein